MKVYTIIVGVIFALILSGCTASTFNEMAKDDRYEKRVDVVNQNYQILYKRALEKSRECHEMGMLTSAIIADGQIYTEMKQAELSIYQLNAGKSMYHGAKFEAIDSNRTTMTIYSRYGGKWFDILKKEFTGECVSCFCEKEDKK